MSKLRKVIELFNSIERKRLIFLLCMILLMSLLEMLGVASILPFMMLVTNPEVIETNFFLNFLFQLSATINIDTKKEFLILSGVLVFLVFMFSISIKAYNIFIKANFIMMCESNLSIKLFENYLNQKYSWFLDKNSADLKKKILSEVSQVIATTIEPFVNLTTHIFVTFSIVFLLLFINPTLTVSMFFVFGLFYFSIFLYFKNKLHNMGKSRLSSNETRFKSTTEAFGAIKELKYNGLEIFFLKRFAKSSDNFAKNLSKATIISQLPRFFLEGFAFGGFLIIIITLMSLGKNFNEFLPILSVYVFAGYKILPSLQQIYNSSTLMRFSSPSLSLIHSDLNNLKKINQENNTDNNEIKLKQNIRISNLSYSYPNSTKKIFKNLNLDIPAFSKLGIVGTTGCGKTTLVDILLGLLEFEEGSIQIDDLNINQKNLSDWQKNLAYVPQQIFLTDDTIMANIAFGVESEEVDHERLKQVCEIAAIHDYISNELPHKYETQIGEQGVRLSGGQRQRIGLARALYKNPKILILDEATSALDNVTENSVIKNIDRIKEKITIIIIAHRLKTVKNCDKIIILEKGKIKAQGKYDELINSEEDFIHLNRK